MSHRACLPARRRNFVVTVGLAPKAELVKHRHERHAALGQAVLHFRRYLGVLDALDDAVAGRPLDPVWQREVLQISHRPYSTGFYFGQPGQYTANSAYFAGAEVCAVVEGTAPDGRAVLTQRNKFAVGDTLELVTNAAPPVTFTAQDLRDADGLPLESVPHPMQRFTMPLPCRAAPLSLVRRKLPAETVDIRLECGKI